MHSRFGKRSTVLGGLLALAVLMALPSVASAVPEAGARQRGFRLFARSLGAITINRIYCGLNSTGEVCVDSNNSSTIGGGYWPKGTADQYVFNSGLQIAGIIDPTQGNNPWAGDTTGGFFFDPKGTTQHGQQVEPIYNSTNPDDVANWPEAARVPLGDAGEDIFFPVLRGRVSASQGDVWWLSWEGNPGLNAGRSHPLGIVVEQRGMGWNYPTGNEDILYFVYTFYNVTSLNEADYAAIRPGMREIMYQKAQDFHSLNNASFGIDLPDEGYRITDMYAAFAADMDVGDAGDNYSSVQLPFALGNTYEATFGQPDGWTFDPGIFAPPFFPGVGFVGVKYLKSPTGPGEIQLFSNTINGGSFGDPGNAIQLWRYLSGNISTAAGDAPCAQGPPQVTRLCYVNNGAQADMRFFQSSTGLELGPGEFGSIVVAYIFAAPVKVASFTPTASTDLKPGNPLRFASPDSLAAVGANMSDSLAGFLDYTDANGDGIAQQAEYTVVPGSLLGKALVAQQVFDNRFLLAFAPEAPEFYLVPGDNQVTVLWRPSPTEQVGDPYFEISSSPTIIPEGGGAPVPNPLYDPNYRQFDVEGYRVYRGRVDAPNSLTLLAQFDYSGTVIADFSGTINPLPTCAPDIGIFTDCPAAYDPLEFQPGVERTVSYDIPLSLCEAPLVQVTSGQRAELASGEAVITAIPDTAITGDDSGFPCIEDSGVPFIYVDNTARNNFRYFYSVTAFDINSLASGPTSIESARITKSVTPRVIATNQNYDVVLESAMFGRDVELSTTEPTINAADGRFSGPFPAANGLDAEVTGFVQELISESGALAIRLDSINLGGAYNGVPHTYFFTVNPGPNELQVSSSLLQQQTTGFAETSAAFSAVPVDPVLAGQFGVSDQVTLAAGYTFGLEGTYRTGSFGRGCVNAALEPAGFGFNVGGGCDYNGVRWFAGPSPTTNETKANPTAGGQDAAANFGALPITYADFNNAGELPGVSIIYENRSYFNSQSTYRTIEGILGGAARAADFNVYWGAGGTVDSVIDVTHNVPVPFSADKIGGTWGILNTSAGGAGSVDGRPGVLTIGDFGCHPTMRQYSSIIRCATTGDDQLFSQTAELGSIALVAGSSTAARAAAAVPEAEPGFLMYLPGHVFSFVLPALPAQGTVWSMRSYIGAISGGSGGPPGDEGPYIFTPALRTFSAVGAEARVVYTVTNERGNPTLADLDRVHTVPDPYYVTNEYEQTTDNKVLKFVNLPSAATIRIYSSSGVLVDVLEHNSITGEGTATWDLRNRNNQVVASGVYFYHLEAGDARRVGRFTIVNFAQ